MILQNNFNTAFPNGLTIGYLNNKMTFTAYTSVKNFLKTRGRNCSILPIGSFTNPSSISCQSNDLARELVTLSINIGLDNAIPSFGSSATNFKDLLIVKSPFFGWSVQQLLDEGNKKIANNSSSNISLNDYAEMIEDINESYENGTTSNDDDMQLICPFVVNTAEADVKCFGGNNGSITVTSVTGAVTPYTYKWSNGATTQSLSNLSAGSYTLVITDKIGLKFSIVYTINQPTLLTANSNATRILCNGGNSTVTVAANGGTPPYSGIGNFTVKAGTYNYTVTDANGCTATTSVTITEPTLLTASSNATAILCKGGNATVTVSGNGGTPPYAGTGNFTKTAGTYNFTLTDANACTATTSVTITEPTLLTASSNATAILCKGANATVTVSGNGGTAPYTGTGNYTVVAGTYNYTVTDANGCSTTTSITVTEPTQLTASSNATAILCKGGNATVTVSGNGGTAPYTGTGNYTVVAGTYNYTVTDANGCSATTSITVTEPTQLTASSNATAILCKGGNATVTVSGNGGTAPYTGTGNYTVVAGTYNYTVTDANGCSATTSIIVSEPTLLTASSNATAILCKGGNATVTVSGNGGTAPYTGTGNYTVVAGTYNYTVTDANGCSATTSIIVSEPTLLTASSNATAILCNGGNATVTISATGGKNPYTGTGNFTKTAGTYNFTVTDANGCAATTSLTINQPAKISLSGTTTYDYGCDGTDNDGKKKHDPNSKHNKKDDKDWDKHHKKNKSHFDDDAEFSDDNCNGTATVQVSGGKYPYVYAWSNNQTDTINRVTGICSDAIMAVNVTDANGCRASYTFNAIQCVPDNDCSPLRTHDADEWKDNSKGKDKKGYCDDNFDDVFPGGLIIGSTKKNQLKLTSSTAVYNCLSSKGTPKTFSNDITNPSESQLNNEFACQLIAATLNVQFDVNDNNFSASNRNIQDMYCNFSPFYNYQVSDLLDEANKVIGGESTTHTCNELNEALKKINRNYKHDKDDDGYLVCTYHSANRMVSHNSNSQNQDIVAETLTSPLQVYPNPFNESLMVKYHANNNGTITIMLNDILGRVIYKHEFNALKGENDFMINASEISSSAQTNCILTVKDDESVNHSGMLVFMHHK